jgi:hypothetical protein
MPLIKAKSNTTPRRKKANIRVSSSI